MNNHNAKVRGAVAAALAMPLGTFAVQAQAHDPPIIMSATVDYARNALTIKGRDFGRAPVVTFDDRPMSTISVSDEQIVANFGVLSVKGLLSGTYLLEIRFANERPALFGVDVGAKGAAGPTGPAGATGPGGPTGDTGLAGPPGPQGFAGPAGPMGPPGAVGPAGAAGPAGPSGPTGPTGTAGPTGVAGAAGAAGAMGPTGPTGPTGLSGVNGVAGPAGAAGPAGPTGPTGPTGISGAAGPVGPAGAAGPSGSPGPTGPTGVTGTTGPVGPAGAAGPFGPTGPTGPQGVTGATGPAGVAGTGPVLHDSNNVNVGPFSFSDNSVNISSGCDGPCQIEVGPNGTAAYANLFLATKVPVYFVTADCSGNAGIAAPSNGRSVFRVFGVTDPTSGLPVYYVEQSAVVFQFAQSVLDASGCHAFGQSSALPLTQLTAGIPDPLGGFTRPFSIR